MRRLFRVPDSQADQLVARWTVTPKPGRSPVLRRTAIEEVDR